MKYKSGSILVVTLLILCLAACGVVDALGPGAETLTEGDRVILSWTHIKKLLIS